MAELAFHVRDLGVVDAGPVGRAQFGEYRGGGMVGEGNPFAPAVVGDGVGEGVEGVFRVGASAQEREEVGKVRVVGKNDEEVGARGGHEERQVAGILFCEGIGDLLDDVEVSEPGGLVVGGGGESVDARPGDSRDGEFDAVLPCGEVQVAEVFDGAAEEGTEVVVVGAAEDSAFFEVGEEEGLDEVGMVFGEADSDEVGQGEVGDGVVVFTVVGGEEIVGAAHDGQHERVAVFVGGAFAFFALVVSGDDGMGVGFCLRAGIGGFGAVDFRDDGVARANLDKPVEAFAALGFGRVRVEEDTGAEAESTAVFEEDVEPIVVGRDDGAGEGRVVYCDVKGPLHEFHVPILAYGPG